RVDVADGPLRVGKVLLTDQHERALRHASRVDVALGGGEFGVAAHDVNGAGPLGRRVGPRDTTFHREVDLECARPLPESPVGAGDPAGQAVAENACDGFGCQVE